MKNLHDPLSESFFSSGESASVAFEVASEGELEQCLPIIQKFLNLRRNVELIYASESVENKCQNLAKKSNGRLRILRLPVLTYNIFWWLKKWQLRNWVSAPLIVLCRYDFYPELLTLGQRSTLALLSASLKGKKKTKLFLLRPLYHLFDFIIAASDRERDSLIKLGIKAEVIDTFDFRIIRINERLDMAKSKLSAHRELSSVYLEANKNKDKMLILGSAWPSELVIFDDPEIRKELSTGRLQVTIAPHILKNDSVEGFKKELLHKLKEIPFSIIGKDESDTAQGPVILCLVPGVLCELYSCHGHAFVGGGHGRSIHSVLEPYLAGCYVYCGPKVFRSTEYDLIAEAEPHKIKIVRNLSNLYHHLLDNHCERLSSDSQLDLVRFESLWEKRFANYA